MEHYYNFCGVPVRVTAPTSLWEDEHSPKFHCAPCAPEINIEITSAPELPTPPGELLGHRGEKYIWRSGTTVTRLTRDIFRKKPHMLCAYDLAQPDQIRCIARQEDWLWATRSQFLWPGVSLPQLLLYHDALVFHASYVAERGQAILFTAPSQTGKSTQAALWEAHRGAHILNGDKAAVSLGEQPMVHGMPFCGTSGICENVSLPLRCIVVLSQAKENTVRRLGAGEALQHPESPHAGNRPGVCPGAGGCRGLSPHARRKTGVPAVCGCRESEVNMAFTGQFPTRGLPGVSVFLDKCAEMEYDVVRSICELNGGRIMEMDTGEALLRAWLELAAMIWNRRMVSGMTFNEAVVSNLLLYRQQQDPAHPMTATELCEKTNMRKSQMNLLLSSLEKQGYLHRERSSIDRRQIHLHLTPAGEEAYHASHQQSRALIDTVVKTMGEEKARELTEQLSAINGMIQAELARRQ